MRYIKFTADTPYCGTEEIDYQEFHDTITEEELNDLADEIRVNHAASFEYLVTGWNYENFEDLTEEEQQELLDNYYADCYCGWEEISQKEYEENT